MKINREKAQNTFAEYTSHYNAQDEKVKLKIDHTYRVAALCEDIAQSLAMTQEETAFAWFSGLLHDVGRFEQLRQYGTFADADSVDHAALGVRILFEEGKIEDYLEEMPSQQEIEFLRDVIACHNAYRVPQEYSAYKKQFADILRDADKIDIFRVNVEVPLEEIYNVTTAQLRQAAITKEVLDSFYEEHAVLRSLKKTAVDHVVGHISLVYELVYPKSVQLAAEQGYLAELLDFSSENEETGQQFAAMRRHMTTFLEKKGINR